MSRDTKYRLRPKLMFYLLRKMHYWKELNYKKRNYFKLKVSECLKSHLNELDYGMSMHCMQQKRASRHSGRSFARGATCAIQFHRGALAVILGQLRWPIYILRSNRTAAACLQYTQHDDQYTVNNLQCESNKVGRVKLLALFSLRLSILTWNFASLLPIYIHTCFPILVDLS